MSGHSSQTRYRSRNAVRIAPALTSGVALIGAGLFAMPSSPAAAPAAPRVAMQGDGNTR